MWSVMVGLQFDADFLGGMPGFMTTKPVPGRLRLTDDEFVFDVHGESFERLFGVPWSEVSGWECGGTNEATKTSSAGRVFAGAVVGGTFGALVGAALKKTSFSALLAVELYTGDVVGLVVHGTTPIALAGSLRAIPAAQAAERATAATTTATSAAALRAWSHTVVDVDQLEAAGADGWEAVGVWVDDGAVRVLCKRPR
jgi:hypothetical protein